MRGGLCFTGAAAAAVAAVPGDVGGGCVACVLPTTRTLEAFSLMHAEGLSAVGVVAEPRGRLVDCLCVSDLRGMGGVVFYQHAHSPDAKA